MVRRRVELIKPLTVISIERTPRGDDEVPGAVRVQVEYSFRDREGNIRGSGSLLEAHSNLILNDDLLERFIASETAPEIATALADLADDPEQEPVVLRDGTLADLLRHGITPQEVWVFLLNHGAAKPTSRLLLDPSQPDNDFVRSYDHSLTRGQVQKRVARAMELCRRTAKALTKVQRVSVAPGLGPLPPLAPSGTNELIAYLLLAVKNLSAFATALRRPPGKPFDRVKGAFRSDWCALFQACVGDHLHPQGAVLFALVFGGRTNVRSFTTLCARARATKVRAT